MCVCVCVCVCVCLCMNVVIQDYVCFYCSFLLDGVCVFV